MREQINNNMFFAWSRAGNKAQAKLQGVRAQGRGYVASSNSAPFLPANSPEGLEIVRSRSLSNSLSSLNGSFAALFADLDNSAVHLVTDRVGSVPLYYSAGPDLVVCGTDWQKVARQAGLAELSRIGVTELFMFGYCLQDRTCVERLYQVPPGTHCVVTLPSDNAGGAPEARYERYWVLQPEERLRDSHHYQGAMEEVTRSLKHKYTTFLNVLDSDALVKLSGGWDSRLTLALFRDYPRIECATYGFMYFSDVVIARLVADYLGVRHTVCRLTGTEILETKRFEDVAGCICARSLTYIGLGSQVIISTLNHTDYVYISGLSLDCRGGNRQFYLEIESPPSAVDATMEYQCAKVFYPAIPKVSELPSFYRFYDQVKSWLDAYFNEMDGLGGFWMLHRFHLENKQSIHIMCDPVYMRKYGVVLLPLWDNEMVDLFSTCSFDLLLKRTSYTAALSNSNFTLGPDSSLGNFPCNELHRDFAWSDLVRMKHRPHYIYSLLVNRILRKMGIQDHWRHSRYMLRIPSTRINAEIDRLLQEVPVVREVLTERGIAYYKTNNQRVFLDGLLTLKFLIDTIKS